MVQTWQAHRAARLILCSPICHNKSLNKYTLSLFNSSIVLPNMMIMHIGAVLAQPFVFKLISLFGVGYFWEEVPSTSLIGSCWHLVKRARHLREWLEKGDTCDGKNLIKITKSPNLKTKKKSRLKSDFIADDDSMTIFTSLWFEQISNCNLTKNANEATHLKVQDYRPDQAQGQFGIAVNDVVGMNVDQLDILSHEKAQSGVDILQHVEAQFAFFARLCGRKIKP